MKQPLIIYSFGHFVVDFLSAFIVFSIPNYFPELTEEMLFFIVVYGVIAFAGQAPLGALCDKVKKPKLFAFLGIALGILALCLLFFLPLTAVIITGIGNALFHIGGGIITLQLGKGKATLPGIFVSTGAMGVFLGTFLPVNLPFFPLWLVLPALLTLVGIWRTQLPSLHYEKTTPLSTFTSIRKQQFFLICFFILFAVFIRSFMGFMVSFPRKTGFLLGCIFTFSVIFGKAFGGILADKFGFEKVGISSLAISSILLGFCTVNPILGLLGIFLFNMTMPITLVVLVNTFKGRPGLAFGLTTVALIFGAIPYYIHFSLDFVWIFISIVTSMLFLALGIHFYNRLLSYIP